LSAEAISGGKSKGRDSKPQLRASAIPEEEETEDMQDLMKDWVASKGAEEFQMIAPREIAEEIELGREAG